VPWRCSNTCLRKLDLMLRQWNCIKEEVLDPGRVQVHGKYVASALSCENFLGGGENMSVNMMMEYYAGKFCF